MRIYKLFLFIFIISMLPCKVYGEPDDTLTIDVVVSDNTDEPPDKGKLFYFTSNNKTFYYRL